MLDRFHCTKWSELAYDCDHARRADKPWLQTRLMPQWPAVSALTAKAKLAGMWREKVDQHNTGNPVYERIERVIVERPPQSAAEGIADESIYDEPSTEVVREMPGRSAE